MSGIPGSISNTVAPSSSEPSRRPTCIMRMLALAVGTFDVPVAVVEVQASSSSASLFEIDDYLHGAAVDAPRGAGHVGGALRAQEHDRRGDLLDLGHAARSAGRRPTSRAPPRRPARPDSAADWSASPPSPTHSSDFVGPGQIAFTSTPSAAQRSAHSRDSDSWAALATEYSGMLADGRLPAVLDDVHDPAPAALEHARDERAHRAVARHHVHLPGGPPVLVGHVVEVPPARGRRRC